MIHSNKYTIYLIYDDSPINDWQRQQYQLVEYDFQHINHKGLSVGFSNILIISLEEFKTMQGEKEYDCMDGIVPA